MTRPPNQPKLPPPPPLSEPLSLSDYKTFFEALVKAVISSATNAKGDIIYVNDKFVEVSQYSREELLGQNHRIVKSGYHPPEFYKALWNTISSGRVWRGEIKNKAKDGTYYWVDTSIAPILGANRKIEKYVSVRFLVTEKKRAEASMRRMATVVMDSNDAITIQNLDGKISAWNRGAERMYGYTEAEALAMNIRDTIPNAKRQEMLELMKRVMDEKVEPSFETQRVTKDDRMLDVWLTVTKLVDDADKLMGIATTERDITERKKNESVLIQKKEELEKSLKELDSFAYSVSHDLKAPLRGIGQVVEWIYEDFIDKATGEQKENMNLMKARIGRMNDMIDGILRYSRLGRGGEVKEQVNLQKLVADVIDSLQPPKNIEVEIEGTLPIVSCVLIQIEQVFQNLINNAIRCMGGKKNGQIKIGCRDKHGECVFYVEDNGPGIPKEHFERIFQIFQTLKPRDEVESTGIGLSIVKKLVELHNGRVWLESEVGKGSTFFFSLPKNSNSNAPERKTI